MSKKASKAPAADEGELRVGLSDLILGSGPKPPSYGRVFSQASSLRFYTQYQEYERSMQLCNSGQSIQRPVLKLTQLLPKSIRSCLSRTFFNGDELEDEDLWEALAKHAECWEGDAIDSSIAAAEVVRLSRMGKERTATDRVDAVQSRLETYSRIRARSVYSATRVGTSPALPLSSAKPLLKGCTHRNFS